MDTVYYGAAALVILIASVFLSAYYEDLRSKWKQIITKAKKSRIDALSRNGDFPANKKETINHTNTNTPVL